MPDLGSFLLTEGVVPEILPRAPPACQSVAQTQRIGVSGKIRADPSWGLTGCSLSVAAQGRATPRVHFTDGKGEAGVPGLGSQAPGETRMPCLFVLQ